MDKQDKIAEARYFLEQLPALQNHRDAFRYTFSAFLSAARSPFQYVYSEIKDNPVAKKWYEEQVSSHAVVQFFRDKRNISIHTKPISLSAVINISVSESMNISDELPLAMIRADGTIERRHAS